MSALETRWGALLGRLAIDARDASRVFAALSSAYGEEHRRYHGLAHVAHVLATLDRLAPPPHAAALELAAFAHDVVYDPRRSDNEARSAVWLRARLAPLGVDEGVLADAERFVLATRDHRAEGDDAALLIDADLVILGADEVAYDRYERAIREEYAWVDDDAYRVGRGAVIDAFLGTPRIFASPLLAAEEQRARRNLERARHALDGPARCPVRLG